MGRVLKVNWKEVSELSKRTLNNSEEFETARAKYQEIINSIPLCWKGTDSEVFVKNANIFLDYLKNDTDYLSEVGKFFKAGSQMYSGVVNEHESRAKMLNQMLEDDNDSNKRSVA